MGILGSFSRLGVQGAAKKIESNRVARIQEMAESGIIKFVKYQNNASEIYNELLQYEDLPITYFGNPEDLKKQDIMYEMIAKLLKNPEYQRIVANSLTYFVIADSLTGKATNGLIAFSEGIISGGLFTEFIPKDEIASIEDKKGWICVIMKNGEEKYLSGMDSKKMKNNSERFLNLFRLLY